MTEYFGTDGGPPVTSTMDNLTGEIESVRNCRQELITLLIFSDKLDGEEGNKKSDRWDAEETAQLVRYLIQSIRLDDGSYNFVQRQELLR